MDFNYQGHYPAYNGMAYVNNLNEANSLPSSKVAQKICGVCGDIAKSYHFGGLSCDSCKAFFRRSVQNDAYLNFQCCQRGDCVISLSTRKSCQYCRMKRCFAIGMEKSWVMTEEERKNLMKARAEKKLQKQLEEQQNTASKPTAEIEVEYEPKVERMGEFLQPIEVKEIEDVVNKYLQAYHHVPYRSELKYYDNHRPGVQIMEMFGTLIRRFAFYSRLISRFTALPFQDQSTLLKGGVLEMCLLRGALTFDATNNRWPNTNFDLYKNSPSLKLDNICGLTSSKLFQMHIEFISYVQQLKVDESIIMLVILVVLFTPERTGLMQKDVVALNQEHFCSLLRKYMDWRFGPKKGKSNFGKLLTKLADLRQLSDMHNHHNLRLGNDEVSSIQQQLSNLKLNPYPELTVIPDSGVTVPTADSHHTAGPHSQYDFQSTAAASGYSGQDPMKSVNFSQSGDLTWNHSTTSNSPQTSNSSATNSPISSCSNYSSYSHHSGYSNYGFNDAEADFACYRKDSSENMGAQFMKVMQTSINQVVSAPCFGFEWVTPELHFDAWLGDSMKTNSVASAAVAGDSSYYMPPIEQSVTKPIAVNATVTEKPLTAQDLQELYEELKDYVDQTEDKSKTFVDYCPYPC